MQERAREQEKVQQNQPAHPSQAVVQTAVHSKTANRHLNAMEMIEWASTRHKREQMRQQQLEQQQQAALQEQQRNQQAALAGPGGLQQPPAAPLPAVSLFRIIAAVFVWIMLSQEGGAGTGVQSGGERARIGVLAGAGAGGHQ